MKQRNIRASVEDCNIADISSVIAEFPEGDDEPKKLPIKKLQMSFEDLANKTTTTTTTNNNNNNNNNHNSTSSHDNSMKVYVRVRPLEKGKESTVRIASDTAIVTTAPEASRRAQYTKTEERQYTFHTVFGPEKDQTEIFNQVVLPLCEKFLSGQTCVLFAYGMSNAGKTHTIEGTSTNPGVLPLLANYLLEKTSLQSIELKLSMLQIYNEKMTDLLHSKKKVTIRDRNGEVDVGDLTYHNFTTTKEATKLITKGLKNRSSGFTVVNNTSSRSHGVYAFTIGSESFYVIDLAGAERNNRTGTSGAQLKEAAEINKSLSLLWRCLNGVKKKNNVSNDPVPFRESKLTHLLMPVLMKTGISGTTMITCINPKAEDYDETLSILANSSMAYEIREIPKIGRMVGPANAQLIHQSSRSSVIIEKTNLRSSTNLQRLQSNSNILLNSKKRDASCLGRKFSQESDTQQVIHSVLSNSTNESLSGDKVDYEFQITLLNEKIAQLEQENYQIQLEQLDKERIIREDVCNEMAERSADLLEQIRQLQDELYSLKNNHCEINKSVKKAKRMHDIRTREVVTKDLLETEEEMENLKANYEKEIKSLKNEVRNLKAEVSDWRKKAEYAMKMLAQMKETNNNNNNNISNNTNNTNNVSYTYYNNENQNQNENENYQTNSIAETFDERMQRDQRFNKHKKLAELSPKMNIVKNSNSNGTTSSNNGNGNGNNGNSRDPLSPVSPNLSDDPERLQDQQQLQNSGQPIKFSKKLMNVGRSPPPSPHRGSDALPIAPPPSDIILSSAPFLPSRTLRSQMRFA